MGGAVEDDITRAAIDIQVLGAAEEVPLLGIEKAITQNEVIVSWPASASNYVLQSSTNVNGPYQIYTGSVSTVSNKLNATVPVGLPSTFFRLLKP